jgi:hypothetical protein
MSLGPVWDLQQLSFPGIPLKNAPFWSAGPAREFRPAKQVAFVIVSPAVYLGPPPSRACDNCVAWSVFSIYLFLYGASPLYNYVLALA